MPRFIDGFDVLDAEDVADIIDRDGRGTIERLIGEQLPYDLHGRLDSLEERMNASPLGRDERLEELERQLTSTLEKVAQLERAAFAADQIIGLLGSLIETLTNTRR